MTIYGYLERCTRNWVSHDLLTCDFLEDDIAEAERLGWLVCLTDSYQMLGERVYYIYPRVGVGSKRFGTDGDGFFGV